MRLSFGFKEWGFWCEVGNPEVNSSGGNPFISGLWMLCNAVHGCKSPTCKRPVRDREGRLGDTATKSSGLRETVPTVLQLLDPSKRVLRRGILRTWHPFQELAASQTRAQRRVQGIRLGSFLESLRISANFRPDGRASTKHGPLSLGFGWPTRQSTHPEYLAQPKPHTGRGV